MSKKKPIIVWRNGKQAKIKRLDDRLGSNSNKKSLSFFARFFGRRNRRSNQWMFLKSYKPIIIASCSAIFIGLTLGFVMLNMMKNMNGSSPEATTSTVNNEENNSSEVIPSSTNLTLDNMNAFVIQVGVFSEKTNAEHWSDTFKQAGLKPIVWEREKQYFILIGLANTMEGAKQLLNSLDGFDFDMFIKEWSTSEEGPLKITTEEHTWLHDFQSTWIKTVESIDKQEDIVVDDWKGLLQTYTSEMEHLSILTELINNYFVDGEMELINEMDAQHALLTIWKEYDQVLIGKNN